MQVRLNETFECVVGLVFRIKFTLILKLFKSARVHYSAAYLSSKTDSFVIAKYRDESGQSGDFIGHTVDARFRYWWDNKTWTLELGLSMLLPGSYLERVREQEQLATDTTKFGYVQLGYKF